MDIYYLGLFAWRGIDNSSVLEKFRIRDTKNTVHFNNFFIRKHYLGFFRAENLADATGLLVAMFDFSKTGTSDFYLVSNLYNSPIWAAGALLLFLPNDMELGNQIKPTFKYGLMTVLLFVLNLIFLNSIVQNDFLYFDF